MPTNSISDSQCRAAKPREKAYKLFDGLGMYLAVLPSGTKTWRLAYRADGKQQTATLGQYPAVTLAAARAKRDELRKRLQAGESVKQPAAGARRIRLREASQQYWPGRQDMDPKSLLNAQNALQRYILPKLGDAFVDEIDRDMMLEALKVIDSAGKFDYVRKVRGWVSAVFDWALANGYAKINPCELINPRKAFGRRKTKGFAALEITEVPAFMQRLELEGLLQSVMACKLLGLTGVRTKELRFMRWDEIDGALWRIPGEKMKKDLDLLVPLSRQSLAIIDHMRARASGSEFVFPNDRSITRPMSNNAILYLIGRMGYAGVMTGHGWRKVMSTWLNEHGFDKDAIERQLAHVPADKIRGIYNRAEFMPERRRMMQAWADWLLPDEVAKALHAPASSDASTASSA